MSVFIRIWYESLREHKNRIFKCSSISKRQIAHKDSDEFDTCPGKLRIPLVFDHNASHASLDIVPFADGTVSIAFSSIWNTHGISIGFGLDSC